MFVTYPLDGAEGLAEKVVTELLETGAGEGLGEIQAVVQRLDLNANLVLVGQRTLGALGLTAQLLHSLHVLGDVLTVLLLDQLHEVLHDTLVEILTCFPETRNFS